MNNSKNPKGAGRKRNFTTEQLLKAINVYEFEGPSGIINASKVARFARDVLGYQDIDYYHFTQNKDAKNRIEEIKNKSIGSKAKFASDGVLSFQSININDFVDNGMRNPTSMKQKISDIQLGVEAMYKDNVRLESENKSLRAKLADKNLEVTNETIKSLKKENKELKDSAKLLKSLIDVDNHMKMVRYILDNSVIEPNNMVDQYIVVLKKCGIITEKDAEELKTSSDAVSITEDDNFDYDSEFEKIINFDDIPKPTDESKIEEHTTTIDHLDSLLDD